MIGVVRLPSSVWVTLRAASLVSPHADAAKSRVPQEFGLSRVQRPFRGRYDAAPAPFHEASNRATHESVRA